MTQRAFRRLGFCLAGSLCLVLVVLVALKRRFPHTSAEAAWRDLRAALAAQHATNAAERFLELRFGSLTNAANRQEAFMHFFDEGHIELMQVAVAHMDEGMRRTNIAATAEWISAYRQGLSGEEQAALRERLSSEAGRQRMRRATQQYLQQDVEYRSATAPVIVELMMTLESVKHPRPDEP